MLTTHVICSVLILCSMKTRPDQQLIPYIEALTGLRPTFEEQPDPLVSSVPLFLRERYGFLETQLFDRRLRVEVGEGQADEAAPTEDRRHAAPVQQLFGDDVVLVIRKMPAYVRNRLVREGIPFIVPGAQMFL